MHKQDVVRSYGALALLLLLLGTLPAAAARPAVVKIETALLDRFAGEGSADFIVRFTEQADLTPAYAMDWEERGWYVVRALEEVAGQAQARAKESLDRRGLRYHTFIAGNELYVWAGDLPAAESVAALPEVASVRAARVHPLDPPVPARASVNLPTASGGASRGQTSCGQQCPATIRRGESKEKAGAADLVSRATPVWPFTPAASSGALRLFPVEGTLAWGLLDTKADQFWTAQGWRGEGIVVANIDTGVDYTHVALQPNYKCGSGPHTACWYDPGIQDCSGLGGGPCDTIYHGVYHGSHTMGTMVGDDDPALLYNVGMAPAAQWIACLGCPDGSCPDFDLAACADWLLQPGGSPDNRPHVVNNSWGGAGGDPFYQGVVQAWRAAGIFPAFSAGNAGNACGTLSSPSDYQESFGSAAHDASRASASFSSRGPSAYGDDPYTKPNLSAPGVNVLSTRPGDAWDTVSGTSMASPHTAGAVALLWSCNPNLVGHVDETFRLLQDNADPAPAGNCGAPPDGQGNYTFGYGYLDVYQAGLHGCGGRGRLSGHVRDANTVDPIANAAVTAEHQGGGNYATATDATGFYTLTPAVGTYTVTASAYGYLPATLTGVVVITDQVTTQDISLSKAPTYLISGTVTEEGTGTPLHAQVTVQGAPLPPFWTDPTSGYYSVTLPVGTYAWHVVAALHAPVDRVVVVDRDQTLDVQLPALPCILLVDDDQDSPDVRASYTTSLDSLGYEYDVWDTASQGNPAVDDLLGYQGVLWYTGHSYVDVFAATNEQAVAAYLDAGGGFLLSSEDYLFEMKLTAFGSGYLGITGYTNDVKETDVVGNAASPIGAGLGPYALVPPAGWSGSLWTDYVSGSAPPFRFQSSGESNSVNHEGSGFRTVFIAWPLEGIADGTSRGNVLAAIIGGLGGCRDQGLVAGRVTHAALGIPLPGVTVTAQTVPPRGGTPAIVEDTVLVEAGIVTATTDPNGRYTLLLPAGTYDVVAQKVGYTTAVVSGVVVVSGTMAVDLQIDSPVAVVNPATLSAYLAPSSTLTLTLYIANAGGVTLSFAISEEVAAPWASEAPVSATVPAGVERDVAIVFSAAPPYDVAGSYTTTLLLLHDDPGQGPARIPVRMTVGGYLIYLPVVAKD